jgi:hypothetical protein
VINNEFPGLHTNRINKSQTKRCLLALPDRFRFHPGDILPGLYFKSEAVTFPATTIAMGSPFHQLLAGIFSFLAPDVCDIDLYADPAD